MNILILNVHSALNLGDDAIMQVTLRTLDEAFPGAHVTVATNDPASWGKYPELTVVSSLTTWITRIVGDRWRSQPAIMPIYLAALAFSSLGYRLLGVRLAWGNAEQRSLLRAYYDADLVLSCGGGNFYADRPLSPAFIWALLALAFAAALGKRVVMLPQSFGPLAGDLQRTLARWAFDRVSLIMVREQRSADFLAQLGVKTPIRQRPDLAFGLAHKVSAGRLTPPQGDIVHQHASGAAPLRPPRIGVTVIDRASQLPGFAGQSAYEAALEALLFRLHKTYGATITVFVQCYGPSRDQDDRAAAHRLHGRLQQGLAQVEMQDGFRDARKLMAAYDEMDLMVGTRLHTGILALCTDVPVLVIGYQPKIFGAMEALGLQRYCCNIETVTDDQLYALACELLDDREGARAKILAGKRQMLSQLDGWTADLKG